MLVLAGYGFCPRPLSLPALLGLCQCFPSSQGGILLPGRQAYAFALSSHLQEPGTQAF